MRTLIACFIRIAAIGLLVAYAPTSYADGHGGSFPRNDFHGRDYAHFSRTERGVWRGGHWDRGWRDGRFAWWWVTGGGWYPYPQPVYPYPTYVPPAIVVPQTPPAPRGLPPSQFWYVCDNPKGYFPYVATCNGPWREVGAAPADNPPPGQR